MQTQENPLNIFKVLKTAKAVGGLRTSMQDPDIEEAVLERALAGQADPSEVVLCLHDGEDGENITVGDLQAAQQEDSTTWKLSERETLWNVPGSPA